MGARLKLDDLALQKSNKLPGPGQYVKENLCGKSLNNSQYSNAKNFSVGKEKRF
jgi:hypothetical protein